jgi:hypothetical protein
MRTPLHHFSTGSVAGGFAKAAEADNRSANTTTIPTSKLSFFAFMFSSFGNCAE